MDLTALYNAIEAESEDAYGEDDDLASDRAKAIDRYLGKNVMPAPDGRSQVVDRTVYETVQWIQPSLARIFASGDDVISVSPVGPEDEAGAKQEAQYLNHVVMQKNNWSQVFDTASKSALMTKAGYLYPYKKVRRQVEVSKYERQTPEALSLILQDGAEILSQEEYPDDTWEPPVDPNTGQPAVDPMTGQPPQQPMLYDVEIRKVSEEPQFCIEVLPPERCRIAKSTKTVQLTDCQYFEYHDWPTVSDLRKDGIDIPDDAPTDGDPVCPYDSPEDEARNLYGEDTTEYNDPSMKRIFTRWCWIQHDTDEDGIAELQYCIVAGQEVRHREEVTRIPVAVLCPDPLPFRHVGLCPADACSDIQDIKTAIMRGGLDNLQLTNNFRTFVNDDVVNVNDLLINRPGGIVRGKKNKGAVFGQDIAPMVVPTVFPQAMEAYGFMEQVNEGRTGVNRYFQGTDQNALNKTASGVQQLSSMAAQRVEQIARNYAPGIEEMASILHELILKSGKAKDRIKVNGQWVEIDPTTWQRRADFKLSVGFAAGNKDGMMARLAQMAEYQARAAEAGLPIVKPENIYATMLELTKAADLSNPERFWTDPSTVEPSPPPPNPLAEVEQIKSQTVLQGKQMDNQSKEAIAQMQDQTKRMEITINAQKDLTLAQHQAEVGAVMNDASHRQSMELERGRSDTQRHLKMLEGGKEPAQVASERAAERQAIESRVDELREGLSQMGQMLTELARIVSAPRVLERDKTGRPIGSRVQL